MTENAKNKAHIIGIGGAGMSAIAILLQAMGYEVQGSDLKKSRYVEMLEGRGIKVFIGHDAKNLGDSNLVIHSTAIPQTNVELVEARKRGVKVLHRSEALKIITEKRKVIAVTGTHGKTTTTSLITHCLKCAGYDPGFLVGGELNDYGSNAEHGSSELFVIEADESDGSFLKFETDYAVVTNLEEEHLDYYKTEENLNEAVKKFINSSRKLGVVCGEDRRLKKISSEANGKVITYGTSDCDFQILSYELSNHLSRFVLRTPEGAEVEFQLKLKGFHNILNAAAASSLLLKMGIEPEAINEGLKTFSGVGRRLEVIGSVDGVDIIDDYAHHPSEIRATLSALKTMPYKRIVAVFQPHRYTRTARLFYDFPDSFVDADFIITTEIYSAGEDPIPGVTGKFLFEKIAEKNSGKKLAYIPRLIELPEYVSRIASSGDAVVFLGAGDITLAARETLKLLLQR